MKKFSLLIVGVLFCTLVFANETGEPNASSVAVTHANGSPVFKLYYTAIKSGDVSVSIFDQAGKCVFTEKIKKTKGFVRPYNFGNRLPGDYTIHVENGAEKLVEKVHYDAGKIEKLVSFVKIGKGKYLLSVKSNRADNVKVNIFNDEDKLINSHERFVDKEFAEVINLKNYEYFTIEVSDSKGLVKRLEY